MFALHIANAWAPELHLVGVVAGAPPSQLALIYVALQSSPYKHYLLMAAAGLNAAYGDEAAPPQVVHDVQRRRRRGGGRGGSHGADCGLRRRGTATRNPPDRTGAAAQREAIAENLPGRLSV